MSDLELLKSLINKVCRPSFAVFPDELENEIIFRRNKAIFPIALGFLPTYIIFMLLTPNLSFLFHSATLIMVTFQVLLWIICCRTSIHIFNWSYFLSVSIYFPVVMIVYFPEHIFFAYMGVFVIPSFISQLTGSQTIFVFSGITQLFFLNTKYSSILYELLGLRGADHLVNSIIFAGNIGVLVNIVLIFGINKSINEAQKMIVREKEQKLLQQRAFVLSLSHELRNPLSSLLGNLELALLEASLNRETKNLLQNANVCGQMLLHLVNNLLDGAKMGIGQLEINAVPQNMEVLIDNVWSICSDMIKKKRLQGLMKISKNMPKILNVDGYRLMQILLNLVGNAVKFTDTGSVNVRVQWIEKNQQQNEQQVSDPEPFDEDGLFDKDEKVSLLTRRRWETKEDCLLGLDRKRLSETNQQMFTSTASQKGILKIWVSDTGCGMSEEAIRKLFQMFSQVHEDPSKRKVGTGLGLYITKELCKRMYGDVKVYSKVSQGTVFIVEIPLK